MLEERTTAARAHTTFARALFDGIAPSYEWPADVLSFGQYGRWRRALVRALAVPRDARVLDVATGTGLIARDIAHRCSTRVIGLDQSTGMLRAARARGVARLVGGSALALPFGDAAFDTVTFSYLFRYVPDPDETLRELVRVLRPGGAIGSVEFGVPRARLPRTGWRAYALHAFPRACRRFRGGWPEVADFLPSNIWDWAQRWPISRQVASWEAAGLTDVRARQMLFGTGVVMTARKPP